MNLKSKNFLLFLAAFFLLGACSVDPRLDDLKIQIKARDTEKPFVEGERVGGILYNRHCCKLYIRVSANSPIGSRDGIIKAVRKQATTHLGEFTAEFPSTFSIGSTVGITLNCYNITALAMDFTQELTDDQCVAYAATGDLVFSQTVVVPADRNFDFRITY